MKTRTITKGKINSSSLATATIIMIILLIETKYHYDITHNYFNSTNETSKYTHLCNNNSVDKYNAKLLTMAVTSKSQYSTRCRSVGSKKKENKSSH